MALGTGIADVFHHAATHQEKVKPDTTKNSKRSLNSEHYQGQDEDEELTYSLPALKRHRGLGTNTAYARDTDDMEVAYHLPRHTHLSPLYSAKTLAPHLDSLTTFTPNPSENMPNPPRNSPTSKATHFKRPAPRTPVKERSKQSNPDSDSDDSNEASMTETSPYFATQAKPKQTQHPHPHQTQPSNSRTTPLSPPNPFSLPSSSIPLYHSARLSLSNPTHFYTIMYAYHASSCKNENEKKNSLPEHKPKQRFAVRVQDQTNEVEQGLADLRVALLRCHWAEDEEELEMLVGRVRGAVEGL